MSLLLCKYSHLAYPRTKQSNAVASNGVTRKRVTGPDKNSRG